MTSDEGSMALAMCGVLVVIAVLSVAVSGLATAYAARAQAANAADSAALAAAVATYPPATTGAPLVMARAAARANGAVVVSCDCAVDHGLRARIVEVVVMIPIDLPIFGARQVSGAARAEFDPIDWLGG